MKVAFLLLLAVYQLKCSFYQKYYPKASSIAKSMSLEQKIGQTIDVDVKALIGSNNITSNQTLIKYSIGGLLLGDNCPNSDGNFELIWGMNLQQLQKVYSQANLQSFKKANQKINYDLRIQAQNKSYVIKPFIGTDAVHGDQRVAGNILFPQNIGISCSHNPQNFYNVGFWTAKSMLRYGFNWAHAPTVAVSHNPQWGRYAESMGQDEDMVFKYAEAYTLGIQGKPENPSGILASVKHFFSDGATFYGANQGSAQVGSFKTFIKHNIQGFNSSVKAGVGSVMPSYSSINFVPLHEGQFINSILRDRLEFDGFVISDDGAAGYCAYQGLPTFLGHMRKNESTATMMNAGVDMFMSESKESMLEYISDIKMGLSNKTIDMETLDTAVIRILAVKIAFGLVKDCQEEKTQHNIQQMDEPQKSQFTKDYLGKRQSTLSEYEDSIKAVHQSLVLLKNEDVIPVVRQNLKYVVLLGESIIKLNRQDYSVLYQNYDNVGVQCGGWSVKFQGFNGNAVWSGENEKSSNASTILKALKNMKNVQLLYPNYTDFADLDLIQTQRQQFLTKIGQLSNDINAENTLMLGVIGQAPYAQSAGDVNIPYCQNPQLYNGKGCMWYNNNYSPQKQPNTLQIEYNEFEKTVIEKVKYKNRKIPLVTVMFSGRPMLINQTLSDSQAFISAFLPGTSGGQGIIDAIFGDYLFRADPQNDRVNTLSIDWPSSMESLRNFPYYAADGLVPRIPNPMFGPGYGLSTKKNKTTVKKLKIE